MPIGNRLSPDTRTSRSAILARIQSSARLALSATGNPFSGRAAAPAASSAARNAFELVLIGHRMLGPEWASPFVDSGSSGQPLSKAELRRAKPNLLNVSSLPGPEWQLAIKRHGYSLASPRLVCAGRPLPKTAAVVADMPDQAVRYPTATLQERLGLL